MALLITRRRKGWKKHFHYDVDNDHYNDARRKKADNTDLNYDKGKDDDHDHALDHDDVHDDDHDFDHDDDNGRKLNVKKYK